MSEQTTTTLKTYFNTGDKPTEAQFSNLIDSFQNFSDSGLKSRVVGKKVLFSDINGGVSPDTEIDLDFVTLAANEIISCVYINSITAFVDSGPNDNLIVDLFDTTNSENLTNNNWYLQGAGCVILQDYITYINVTNEAPLFIHLTKFFSVAKDIKLRFSATDLTLLTAGELDIYVKIDRLPTV